MSSPARATVPGRSTRIPRACGCRGGSAEGGDAGVSGGDVLGDAQRGGNPQAPRRGQVQHLLEVYHRVGALRLLRWQPVRPFGANLVSRLRAGSWRKRTAAVTVVVR